MFGGWTVFCAFLAGMRAHSVQTRGDHMVSRTYSSSLDGIEGTIVEIEASCLPSLPKIQITGLAGEIVKESRERVRACLNHLGFDVPTSHVLVHLSPASSRKQGSQFDIAIAISVLVAEGILASEGARNTAFLGELCLDGRLSPVAGSVAMLEALEHFEPVQVIILPKENQAEAAVIGSRKARLASHLGEVIDFLRGQRELGTVTGVTESPALPKAALTIDCVQGQSLAKRALQIAIAGRHHLLLLGPPGVGKTLLAHCMPSLLPPVKKREAAILRKNYAFHLSELPFPGRPFRAPHHSVSSQGLLGGGTGTVMPGEVTLADLGVLFLDELPEFHRDAIEGLREPLQNGEIRIHRVGEGARLPARFTLVAAMNPCPCGLLLSPNRRCRCPRDRVAQYRRRVSQAVLDRMDLLVVLSVPRFLAAVQNGLTHAEAVLGIERACQAQWARYGTALRRNGDAPISETPEAFALTEDSREWLRETAQRAALSFRAHQKLVRVSRTLADLEGCAAISIDHLREAWELRCGDFFARVFD